MTCKNSILKFSVLKTLALAGALVATVTFTSGCNKTSPNADSTSASPQLDQKNAPVAAQMPMDDDTSSGTTSGDAHTPDMTPAPQGTPGASPVPTKEKMESKNKKNQQKGH
jgi:hypothetical protein